MLFIVSVLMSALVSSIGASASESAVIAISILAASLIPTADFIVKPIFHKYISKKYKRDEKLTYWVDKTFGAGNIEVGILYKPINNAYSLGIAPFKQVIEIGQPLVQKMSEQEINAIILHEIGHSKKNHLFYLYIASLFCTCIAVWLLYNVQQLPFFKASVTSEYVLVALVGAISWVFFYTIPGIIQRHLELQADAFSASMVGVAQYEQALRKLDEITNGEVTKGGINYPTLQQRIDHIKKVVKNDTIQKMVI
jgi:Zn-dependent protease with chaperone function